MRRGEYSSSNIPTQLSLADLLMRDDLAAEPLDAFLSLLQAVSEAGHADEIAKVCDTITALFSENRAALRAVTRAKIRGGAPEEAAAYLEAALLQRPDDLTLLRDLALAYDRCGQPSRAAGLEREIRYLSHGPQAISLRPDTDPVTTPSLLLVEEASTTPSLLLCEVEAPGTEPSLVLCELAETMTLSGATLCDTSGNGTASSVPKVVI